MCRVSQSIILINNYPKLSNRMTAIFCPTKSGKLSASAEVAIKITLRAFVVLPGHAQVVSVISFSRGLTQQLVTRSENLLRKCWKIRNRRKNSTKSIDLVVSSCHVVHTFATLLPNQGKTIKLKIVFYFRYPSTIPFHCTSEKRSLLHGKLLHSQSLEFDG
jgi:hypothetical protein